MNTFSILNMHWGYVQFVIFHPLELNIFYSLELSWKNLTHDRHLDRSEPHPIHGGHSPLDSRNQNNRYEW